MKISHNKLIICDVDEVLLNWSDSFLSWLGTTGLAEYHGMSAELKTGTYQISEWLQTDSKLISMLIYIFNSTHWVKNLPPVEGSVKYVAKLVDQGYTLHALTSFSTDYESHEMRKNNLEKIFGARAFSGFTFLPLRVSKSDQLKSFINAYTPAPWYIDDHGDHVIAGQKLGIPSILFDPYARFVEMGYDRHEVMPYENISRSWENVYQRITGE